MASRLGRRAFLNVSRSASAAGVRVAGRNAGRRLMSSSAEHAQSHAPSSDLPWQIGSAAIFGPLCFWLLTGQGQDKAKHSADHHAAKDHSEPAHETAAAPIKDDEGTEASAEEVKESAQKAFNEDSPKDAQAAEEKEASSTPSTEESLEPKEEAPKSSEPESPVTESGVPKGEDAESAPVEQKEKPADSEEKKSTLQNEDTGKGDLGEARSAAKSGQDPKQAEESQ